MTTRITKHLLTGTSALALIATFAIAPAFAATSDEGWVTLTFPDTQTQTAGATNSTLNVTGVNFVAAGGSIAATNTNQTGTSVVINTTDATKGLSSTGDNSTLSVTGTGTITDGITITQGTITGASTTATKGSIVINGAAATTNIANSANGTISNTGAGGNAIFIGSTGAINSTITNAGTISNTANSANSYAIKVLAGNTVTVNNSGTINAGGTTSNAINLATTALGTINNTGAGAITGKVDLGTNTGSSLNLSGTSTLTGAVTMGAAGQVTNVAGTSTLTGAVTMGGGTLNLSGGQVVGAINGAGIINVLADYATNGVIGTGTAITTINIDDGKTLNADTNDNAITATNINVGNSGSGATLTMGTGALTATVNSSNAGHGTVNFNGNNTLGAGTTIGATTSFQRVVIADGVTVDASGANATIAATNVVLGSSTGVGSTLTLGTGAVTGAIDGLVAGQGVVNLTQNNTLNGNIGATTGIATVAISANRTINAQTNNNSITATNVTLASGAILNLGTGAVTGIVDGTGNNLGTVNFSGTQTTAGTIGSTNNLAAVNINSGGNVTLGAVTGNTILANLTTINTGGALHLGGTAHTLKGDITVAGTGILDIGSAFHTLSAGDHAVGTAILTTAATTSTLGVTINSGTANDSGKLTATTITYTNAPTIVVDSSHATSFIADGTDYVILVGTGAAAAPTAVNGDTLFIDWVADTGTVGSLKVQANRTAATYQSVATTSNNQSAGSSLFALGNNTNAQISAFQGRLDGMTTTAQVDTALKEVTPQVNATSVQAMTATGQSLDVIGTRLSDLRAGIDNSASGMAAGGAVAKNGVWLQGFGTTAKQDLRQGVDGYDADTVGIAIGGDTLVDNGTRLGISGSYATSDVDSNGTAVQKTDVETWQANVYASYGKDRWFTDALAGFAYHNYDSNRLITSPTLIAKGDFNGQTYTGRVGGGYRLNTGGLEITPNTSLTYFYNQTNGYTETGAGGLSLRVDDHSNDALIGRIGADVGRDFAVRSVTLRPVLRAAYMYDFIGDQVSTNSTFTGGGATFRTRDASPEQSAYNLGASLNVANASNVSLSLDYDYLAKSGYDAHSGMVRARYSF